ncbi:hypothetical protein QQS21_006505 [Conoideocrella luteorostrata]|uniref:Ribosome biogenesis protein Urb1 n=1 Tax=Conoideocrella luteorostrata TaxID=1105319 RepID=A0AAJ0FSU5_9HYPO|nr:hypothetical protein QQS21_006505 [Conoideocrella luteorostrata]
MVKRSPQSTDGAAAFRKRQKLSQEIPIGEDVSSSEQLRSLLTFDQDLRNARHGLQSFKRILDSIISNDDDRQPQLAILQGYLESVKPRDTSEDAAHLHDIMEMWSFAIQANDEGVMSAVAIVLALVLHIVSDSLHLVPHGLGICRTLLQETQLKSISRNLASDKSKGFIISPTLRLLREAACLDGGAYTKKIVRARAFTFMSLSRNLEIGHMSENQEDLRKASIRAHAVRLLLSCLKFLHSEGRRELLSQRDLLSHLTYMIKNDPPHLILEIMDTLKSHVLMDCKIPREIKFRAFNINISMRFLSLYTYSHPTASEAEKELVSDRAHEFLTYACTTPDAGLLYPYRGLYPKNADDEFTTLYVQHGRNRETGDPWEGKLKDGIPVYNFALSEFVSKLRPWSSSKHCELIVAIFAAAPELISDYFYNNQSFTFEPKLSMTWIGYATFLFNTMMIPLPASFGDAPSYAVMPPPTSVLLDVILPRPINRKVLVRCLSVQSHLTSFFATRILVAGLEKFAAALKMLDSQSKYETPSWADASRRLVDMFCQRIPDMKEVARCYKSIPPENFLHKTLTSRLLRLYYEVIPRVALAANFDVSPLFADVFKILHKSDETPERKKLGVMELENLVSIASYSPGMRWFAKLESLGDSYNSFSPFSALLKLLCSGNTDTPLNELKVVLRDVAVDSQVVKDPKALKPLLQAVICAIDALDSRGMASVWSFLDNCINRCATSPIKYLELMKYYSSKVDPTEAARHTSLLHVVVVEQLPYALSADGDQASHLAAFVSLYFNAVQLSSKSDTALVSLYKEAERHFSSTAASLTVLGNGKQVKTLKKHDVEWRRSRPMAPDEQKRGKEALSQEALGDLLHVPFSSAEDASVLAKWASKSVEDMVEDGWSAGLVRLLASEHINLRKEALTSILKMAAQIKESSYEEKMQVWLLLSEVAESAKVQVDAGPVPSAFTAFTIHALGVLKNPMHPLYPKVNSYLTRSPIWGLDKLPLAHDILHGTPSEDDKYYTELTWLLNYLLDSLKTPFDLGIFHKKRWFEKILALGCNPYLRSALRNRLLRLVYRATCIEAGSTTLMTRFGVLSWLDTRRAACDVEEAAIYEALTIRAWQTCDQERVRVWSKGGVQQLLEKMA